MLFRARKVMDEIEDYWERGRGTVVPPTDQVMHALAVYGWDLRDTLSRTAASCRAAIAGRDDTDAFLRQIVSHNGERAALSVFPGWDDEV